MTSVGWYVPPCDPVQRAEALARNLRNGHAPVPGVSDHELGWLLRADAPRAPLYVPNRCQLAVRTTAAPARWLPFWIALFVVVATAGLVAVMVR